MIRSCAILLFFISSVWAWASETGPSANRPAEQPLPPPFRLTSDEQKEVDRLLDRWERWNSRLKTFDCRFTRWTYDLVFGSPTQPKFVDLGIIKYAAPNRMLYRVDTTEKDGRQTPIDNARAEHWIYDGKSVFEYSRAKKQVIEFKLPTEVAESHLVDGPLGFGFAGPLFGKCIFGIPPRPYPFGAKDNDLKQCHYIRTTTPPDRPDEIWLEAHPRFRQAASLYREIQLIFTRSEMSPVALKIVQPNGKDYTTYKFFDTATNDSSSPATDDPFHPTVPPGWQQIVEEPLPLVQANREPEKRP